MHQATAIHTQITAPAPAPAHKTETDCRVLGRAMMDFLIARDALHGALDVCGMDADAVLEEIDDGTSTAWDEIDVYLEARSKAEAKAQKALAHAEKLMAEARAMWRAA